ncbi:NAD(P)-dependent oxidoreductase [Pusillimonas noertemannii]|uniref:3-hydroxyisobutyrate dehydrogenase n=1 Tax=Pusillimonas noertemannii TaxID=305977 RepID=A0A2U1CQN1_9BURK|nr:NAD(P)-dependent oxidoreductase [Pusillimonas noertemannii]NYT67524.1 NAD(P)-dependent oxidoreductase [Pusillimonas noertemannii]PVY68197.1 3-hydroxyisobutyrate dehydrogenase [Pusillimonas noertemannii]TFL12306.1 NAD(P)-dependent oxidoreductase [Pusillimonas noertemannii]
MIKTVGVIGAGRMGMPIVGHLNRAGFEVLVSERDSGRWTDIKERGGHCVELAELASRAEVVLICVGYEVEVRELLCAPGGLIELAPPGAIIAVLSTTHPKSMIEFAQLGEERDLIIMDSTVCRGAWAADEGTLLSFVGGEEKVVDRLEPVMRAYSSDVVHTGGIGTAQASRAANNQILWACLVANHEALALAQTYDVNIVALRQALLSSSATNGSLSAWGKQTMAWAEDDMAIVSEMAVESGLSLPQSGVVREVCRALKPRRYRLEEYGR